MPIVLQKSKVAGSPIFRENTKREAIADSYRRNRVVEVACEFNVRRPSHLYRKPRLRPLEFLILGAKRLLRHNRPSADVTRCLPYVRFGRDCVAKVAVYRSSQPP